MKDWKELKFVVVVFLALLGAYHIIGVSFCGLRHGCPTCPPCEEMQKTEQAILHSFEAGAIYMRLRTEMILDNRFDGLVSDSIMRSRIDSLRKMFNVTRPTDAEGE
jgi:hypothetical protein